MSPGQQLFLFFLVLLVFVGLVPFLSSKGTDPSNILEVDGSSAESVNGDKTVENQNIEKERVNERRRRDVIASANIAGRRAINPDVQTLDRYLTTCQRCLVPWDTIGPCPLNDMALELTTWLQQLTGLMSGGCRRSHMHKKCANGNWCCLAKDPRVTSFIEDILIRIRGGYRVLQKTCDRCPVDCGWSGWSSWTTCSVTCGTGIMVRTRSADNPPAKHGGRFCEGSRREQRPCSPRECCIDGIWGPWQQWSECTAECWETHRTKTRTRCCDNPSPNQCGRPCPGPSTDRESCSVCEPPPPPPCVDSNWGPWQPWSRVSVTCGVGQRDRRRRCDNPAANYCGRTCPGRDIETESYDTRVPCRICEWTRWSRWSSCSATCPPARRRRTRQCLTTDNQYRQDCYCPGKQDDEEECRLHPCTEWTGWGTWCPCDCRKGIRSRRRSCEIILHPSRKRETVSPHLCRDHSRTGNRKSIEAREEESCDVAKEKSCPKCITSCYGKTDGAYPSCSSCSSYYNCTDGRGNELFCRPWPPYEWDAFKSSCQPYLSPSCNPLDIHTHMQGDDPVVQETTVTDLESKSRKHNTTEKHHASVIQHSGTSKAKTNTKEDDSVTANKASSKRFTPSGEHALTTDRAENVFGTLENDRPKHVKSKRPRNKEQKSESKDGKMELEPMERSDNGSKKKASGRTHLHEGQERTTESGSATFNEKKDLLMSGRTYKNLEVQEQATGGDSLSQKKDQEMPERVYKTTDDVQEPKKKKKKKKKKRQKKNEYKTKGNENAKRPNRKSKTVEDKPEEKQPLKRKEATSKEDQRPQKMKSTADTEEEDDEADMEEEDDEADTEEEDDEADTEEEDDGADTEEDDEADRRPKSANETKRRHARINTFVCKPRCSKLNPGHFPSCRGCRDYVLCTRRGRKLERRCPENRLWDDIIKKCVKRSRTCSSHVTLP